MQFDSRRGALVRRGVPWRRLAAAAGGLGLLGVMFLGFGVTCRPAWYRPGSIDYRRLRADKAELLVLQERISAALNAGDEVHVELEQEQINRWLAARSELWPEAEQDWPVEADPAVVLGDDSIRVALTLRRGGFAMVVGVDCRITAGRESVMIALDRVRLGAVPVPRARALDRLRAALSAELGELPLSGNALLLKNAWVWPNGKRTFAIRDLQITEGRAAITLSPREGARARLP